MGHPLEMRSKVNDCKQDESFKDVHGYIYGNCSVFMSDTVHEMFAGDVHDLDLDRYNQPRSNVNIQ